MTIDLTRLAVAWGRRRRSGLIVPERLADGPVIGMADGGAPVVWPTPARERAGHVACFASSGGGKTMMVSSGVVGEIAASSREKLGDQAIAFLIKDAKGDFIKAMLEGLAFAAPERLADVYYLDPFDLEAGFPFNLVHLKLGATPIEIRALQLAGLVAELSTASGSQRHLGTGSRQVDVIQNLLLGSLANQHPQANVGWSLDALLLKKGMHALARLTTSERARAFLATARLSDELTASCAARLRLAFAATASLERMMSAPRCIQFDELLAPGRITLIDLGRPIGGLSALQEFWANMLGRLAIEYLLARPSPWPGNHCRIVIDEAQVVASVLAERAEAILTTGRSRGISLAIITQGTTLLNAASDTLLRVLLTNTPTKFIGRLAAADAELLAREQAPSRGVDEKLSVVRGRFVASVTNLADREWFHLTPGQRRRFTSVPVDVEAWRRAADVQAEAIAMAKRRLMLPSDTPRRLTLADVAVTPPRRSKAIRTAAVPPVSTATVIPDQSTATAEESVSPTIPVPVPRSRWG